MGALFFVFFFALLALGLFAVKKVKFDGVEYKVPRALALIPLAFVVLILALSCIKTVSPGKVAVPVAFGHTGSSMGSGLHLVAPWVDLKTFSTRQEGYTMSVAHSEGNKQGDDSITVLGRDGGGGHVDATLLFHVPVSNAGKLYREIGTDYIDKIVRPTSRKCIRDAFTEFDMVDAATTARLTVADSIRRCIETTFNKRFLSLDEFQMRDVSLDDKLKEAVLAKVSSQQNAERQVFEVQTAEGQARVKNINNKATADGQQILACGGHNERRTNAAGKEVEVVVPNDKEHCNQTQLTPAFLQYSYIQALEGLVHAPNNSTVILPFDQNLTPLLNLNK